jgi:hypothetical protein
MAEYRCYKCNEDLTEKVLKKASERKVTYRMEVDVRQRDEVEVDVNCSKGHSNTFKVKT